LSGGATRRAVIAGGLAAAALPLGGGRPARAGSAGIGGAGTGVGTRHGLSTFGDLKYPTDFTEFDYVDPDAPKGGRLVTSPSTWAGNQNPDTFNSFNAYIVRGDTPPGIQMTFAALMARAYDEPDAVYGYVAESVTVAADGDAYTFQLRPTARFHDGTPITAEDVAFSYRTLQSDGHPDYAQALSEVAEVVAEAPERVTIRFTGRQSRGAIGLVSTFPIFSAAYYSGRTFDTTTLEPPLGSGPYKIGAFQTGSYIEYQRVKDHWAAELPVMRGQNNFDVIRYEFFRERAVGLEAFKAGQTLLREEFTALAWSTQYDFPAALDGRVARLELEDLSPSGGQGWHINLRRDTFKDIRVREALGLAFDFEWSNRNLFFGHYKRTQSPFANTEFEAQGRPSADELVLLEPFRGQVPEATFGPAVTQPVTDGSGRDRAGLRRAAELLAAAGWRVSGGVLRDAAGTPFRISFLDNSTAFARVLVPYIANLKLLGIEATHEVVDASQYQARSDRFDFDLLSRRMSFPATPDESLKLGWYSSQAGLSGSANLSGLADPAVDALIDKALRSKSRAELTLACRALDRVLRATRYWIPQWYKPNHWLAYWDVYRRPAAKPRYNRGVETTWWLDAARARALQKGL
jgi:microcin C transport system substrate-binding protein